MNTHDLVRGAVLSQDQNGTDILDTMRTDAFKNMSLKSKVDFINEYARTNQPEPTPLTAVQKVKHVIGTAGQAGAVGGLLGVGAFLARSGKGGLGGASKMFTARTEAEHEAADAYARELLGSGAAPAQIGALIGGYHGYSGMKEREQDKRVMIDNLRKIRQGTDTLPVAAAVAFNAKDTAHADSMDIAQRSKSLRETYFPMFGVTHDRS